MRKKFLCSYARNEENKQLECMATSPYFVTIAKDQRIRVWETSTGNLYAQMMNSNHLKSVYTCLDIYCNTKVCIIAVYQYSMNV